MISHKKWTAFIKWSNILCVTMEKCCGILAMANSRVLTTINGLLEIQIKQAI